MKSIKEYMGKIVEGVAYALMATPFVLGIGIPLYQAHASDFIKNYNQAVIRNADIDGDGQITPTEELKFKQTLVSEIAKLKQQGQKLDDIVDWLETR